MRHYIGDTLSLMPTCPHCDVAYLLGEKHVCPRPDGRHGRTLGVLLLIVGLAVFTYGASFYIKDRSISTDLWPLEFVLPLKIVVAPAGVVLAFIGTALLAMFRK